MKKTKKVTKPAAKKSKKAEKKPVKTTKPKGTSHGGHMHVPVDSRVATGVINLDPLIEKGLVPKSINLVVGDAGSGKTIFAMQFLMEGLRHGESCIYITFEEKKDKLYEDMAEFGWDFEKFESSKDFTYLEYSPEQVKSLIEEGGGTVDQLITKKKVSRLVIDSITSFSLLYQDELSKKEAGLALFELINKWGCTAVLTSQAISRRDELITSSLEFEADSIILLYHVKQKSSRLRALEILKMRGTKHSNKTMEMNISSHGIEVHPGKAIDLEY